MTILATAPQSLTELTDKFLTLTMPRPRQEKADSLEITQIDQREYLCNGEILKWQGAVAEVNAPFLLDGEKVRLGSYPKMSKEAALQVLDAAKNAYADGLGEWPSMTSEERISCLQNFTEGMQEKREEVVNLLMYEIGKTSTDAYKEFDRTVEYIKNTIKEYRKLNEEGQSYINSGGDPSAFVERTPLGVTLCMAPFNYPLNETFTSLIPALITGNTIIMKPAKFGVLLFDPLLEAFRDSFPKGVVNTVYNDDGAEVITPIMQSGKVDTLAFIGSTKVANLVSGAHPNQNRLTKILGLGAHNPSITLKDADLDKIMPEILAGSLSFNGQRCTTLALHYVQSDVSDAYAEKLATLVEKMKAGLPWEKDVKITALPEGAGKISYLRELIEDAVAKGARIMNRGGGTLLEDNLMIPAVLYPVTKEMRIFREEQFGPIVPITKFNNLKDVVKEISTSEFGQQISIFGGDKAELLKAANSMKNLAGRVNINRQCQRGPDELPFTGKKNSALGTLSLKDALLAFTTPTVIAGDL